MPTTFSDDFSAYADGSLGSPWLTQSVACKIVSHVARSDSATNGLGSTQDNERTHGLTFTSKIFQIDFDCTLHTISSEGVGVGLLSSVDFSGYAVFCSNNIHIQEFLSGGTHNNLTNDGWASGGGGLETHHITFTCDGTNLTVYVDGSQRSQFAVQSESPGDWVFIELESTTSSFEVSLDNVVVQNFIGAAPAAAAPTPPWIPGLLVETMLPFYGNVDRPATAEIHTTAGVYGVLPLTATVLDSGTHTGQVQGELGLAAKAAQSGTHTSNAYGVLGLAAKVLQQKQQAQSVYGVLGLAAKVLDVKQAVESIKAVLGLSGKVNDVKTGTGQVKATLGITGQDSLSGTHSSNAKAVLGLTANVQQQKQQAAGAAQGELGLTARLVDSKTAVEAVQGVLGLTAKVNDTTTRTGQIKAVLGLTAKTNDSKTVASSVKGVLGITAKLLSAGAGDFITGALGLAGKVLGQKSVASGAQGFLGLSAKVLDQKAATGTVTGALGLTGKTSDVKTATGRVTGAVGFSGKVVQQRVAVGQVRGTLSFSGIVAGVRTALGRVLGVLGFTGTAERATKVLRIQLQGGVLQNGMSGGVIQSPASGGVRQTSEEGSVHQ